MMKDAASNGFMARLQLDWAWAVRRQLGKVEIGTVVKYLNSEKPGHSCRDTVYDAISTVAQYTEAPEDLITTWADRKNGE